MVSMRTDVAVDSSRSPIVRLLNNVSNIALAAIRLSTLVRPSLAYARPLYSPIKERNCIKANVEVNSI